MRCGGAGAKQTPGVKVIEEENVPETVAVAKTMESMINIDGASLLFRRPSATSTRSWSRPRRSIPRCSSATRPRCGSGDKHPMNLGGYFCYLDQAHYVNGIAAGLSTKSNKIGYIAAKPIALVLRNVNAFTLGVQEGQSEGGTVRLIITGDWALPVREAEATNALIDAGCDVIACHVDSPKVVVETRRGPGRQELRPQRRPVQARAQGLHHRRGTQVGHDLQGLRGGHGQGQPLPNLYQGGYRQGHGAQHRRSAPVPARPAEMAAMAAIAELKRGAPIFVGPIKDNTGKVVIPKTLGLYDPSLWETNYLVEGRRGSTT